MNYRSAHKEKDLVSVNAESSWTRFVLIFTWLVDIEQEEFLSSLSLFNLFTGAEIRLPPWHIFRLAHEFAFCRLILLPLVALFW